VQTFAMMTVNSKANENLAFVEELLRQGLTESEIFLDLIGPAARFLGEQWEDDRVDFLEVTLGLVSMHELTHRLGYEYQAGPQTLGPTYRIMLSCVPGSMHLLGPVIVSSFFRAEGWQVVLEVSPTESELSHAVANEWFDVVGVSVSTSDQLTKLKQLVKVLKKSSRNPSLSVLAGGPIFLDTSLSADKFGLDSICTDPQEAVEIAGGFARARSLG
jgi:methanogenic corrinoid protein MtbC1